jgi:hypothetical protein
MGSSVAPLVILADLRTIRSQDSGTPRRESDDGTQSWCRLWTYVSPLLPILFEFAFFAHTLTAATLMRSRNPGAEFADMAGKALTIEWLVENAPTIFPPLSLSTAH